MKIFKVMGSGDVQVLPDDWLLDKLESKSFNENYYRNKHNEPDESKK
jgi:hypothetical protein